MNTEKTPELFFLFPSSAYDAGVRPYVFRIAEIGQATLRGGRALSFRGIVGDGIAVFEDGVAGAVEGAGFGPALPIRRPQGGKTFTVRHVLGVSRDGAGRVHLARLIPMGAYVDGVSLPMFRLARVV